MVLTLYLMAVSFQAAGHCHLMGQMRSREIVQFTTDARYEITAEVIVFDCQHEGAVPTLR